MSKPKWTPGPWRVRKLGDDCFVEAPAIKIGESLVGPYFREIMSDALRLVKAMCSWVWNGTALQRLGEVR